MHECVCCGGEEWIKIHVLKCYVDLFNFLDRRWSEIVATSRGPHCILVLKLKGTLAVEGLRKKKKKDNNT